MMERKGNSQNVVIIMLTVAIVIMSVGFALSDFKFSLTGNTTIKSSSWDVSFRANSFVPREGSNSIEATNVKVEDTTVTYDLVLSNVGDVFNYDIIVENTGNFDAKLKEIKISDLSAHSDYLSFVVNYNNNSYTTSTTSITNANVLNALTGSETINLKAEYLKPEDANKLPSEDVVVSITVELIYGEV